MRPHNVPTGGHHGGAVPVFPGPGSALPPYGFYDPMGMPLSVSGTPMAQPGGFLEAFDTEVKANIQLPTECLFQTYGLMNAFNGGGARNTVRPKICVSFTANGMCRLGETCRDLHPVPQAVMSERARVYAWMQMKETEFLNHQEAVYKVFYSDLKEVIAVPATALSFTRGLFLDPIDREKRPIAAGGMSSRHNNPTAAQQAPTACGLFAANPSNCKWGRFCNQAHVSSQWIEEHRRRFEEWSSSLEAHFHAMAPDETFNIHDPLRRVLVTVPKAHIATFTRGLLQGTEKCPSMCLLFLNGRCTAMGRCNQAHVDPAWLRQQSQPLDTSGLDSGSASDNVIGTHSTMLLNASRSTQQPASPPGSPHTGTRSSLGFDPMQPQATAPSAESSQDGVRPPNMTAVAAPVATQRVEGNTPHYRFSQNPTSSKLSMAPTGLGALSPPTPPDAGVPQAPPMLSPIRPPGRSSGQLGAPRAPTPPYFAPSHGYRGAMSMNEHCVLPQDTPPDGGSLLRTPSVNSTRGPLFSFPLVSTNLPTSPLCASGNGPSALRVSMSGFEDALHGEHLDSGPGDSLTALPPSLSAAQGGRLMQTSMSMNGHPSLERAGASLTSPPTQGTAPTELGAPLTPLSLKSPARGSAPKNPRYSPSVKPTLLTDVTPTS